MLKHDGERISVTNNTKSPKLKRIK